MARRRSASRCLGRTTWLGFESATLQAYQAVLQGANPAGEAKADVPAVQQALIAVQEKALVWRAARGVYALEEASFADLMAQRGLLADVA